MCGCMLMHATMNHQEQQSLTPTAPGVNVVPAAGGQICAHCGFLLQQEFFFCPGCGADLRIFACPACGQKVDQGWSACAYCGSPLGASQAQVEHH